VRNPDSVTDSKRENVEERERDENKPQREKQPAL